MVVTSLLVETSAAPAIESSYLQWPLSAIDDVLPAWQAWAPGAVPELWSTIKALGGERHPNGAVLLISATWVGEPGGLGRELDRFLRGLPAPPVRSDHSRSYLDAMLSYAGCADTPIGRCHTGPGGSLAREAFGATSHIAYEPLDRGGLADLVGRVESAQGSGLLEAGISIDALGGRVADMDPDETAFVHRRALATVQYTATYAAGGPHAADDFVRGFRSAMTPHWGDHAYVNYADPTLRHPQAAYFGANAARLSDVRGTYDPDRFFDQPQGW